MNAVLASELGDAECQHKRAVAAGDNERRWYWADVLFRVRRGERLAEARRDEAGKRNGPLKVVTIYGTPTAVRDLDVWQIGRAVRQDLPSSRSTT